MAGIVRLELGDRVEKKEVSSREDFLDLLGRKGLGVKELTDWLVDYWGRGDDKSRMDILKVLMKLLDIRRNSMVDEQYHKLVDKVLELKEDRERGGQG